MAVVTITGLTAARMIEIERASVVSGKIEGDNLVLTTKGGRSITAGNVRGPKGDEGPVGNMRDATDSKTGAVKLAGNLGGTAEEPRVVGNLSPDTNVAYASIRFTWRDFLRLSGVFEDDLESVFESEFEPTHGGTIDDLVDEQYDIFTFMYIIGSIHSIINQTVLRSDITNNSNAELWFGSLDDYNVIPTDDKNNPSTLFFIWE